MLLSDELKLEPVDLGDLLDGTGMEGEVTPNNNASLPVYMVIVLDKVVFYIKNKIMSSPE